MSSVCSAFYIYFQLSCPYAQQNESTRWSYSTDELIFPSQKTPTPVTSAPCLNWLAEWWWCSDGGNRALHPHSYPVSVQMSTTSSIAYKTETSTYNAKNMKIKLELFTMFLFFMLLQIIFFIVHSLDGEPNVCGCGWASELLDGRL